MLRDWLSNHYTPIAGCDAVRPTFFNKLIISTSECTNRVAGVPGGAIGKDKAVGPPTVRLDHIDRIASGCGHKFPSGKAEQASTS